MVGWLSSRLCIAACILLGITLGGPVQVDAATFEGRIVDVAGVGLAEMEVRLWRDDDGKGFRPVHILVTGAGGGFSFVDVEPGEYKLDARMAPGFTGNYSDRWYDVEEPSSDGWRAGNADIFIAEPGVVFSDLQIVMLIHGGLEGRVVVGGTPREGVRVRAEIATDHAIHHNDTSRAPCCGGDAHWGWFYFRGLVPSEHYRLLAYDPDGRYELNVVEGPYHVTASSNIAIEDVNMSPVLADPYAPNSSPADAASALIDLDGLRDDPTTTWSSVGAVLAPRDGDVDWFCFEAQIGDRFIASVSTAFDLGSGTRYHPWFDPVLSFWRGPGSVRLAEDDDSGPGPFGSEIDTGILDSPGVYCFAVSAFGDTEFNGENQGSSGRYTLDIMPGNRPPTVELTRDGNPTPTPPTPLFVEESQTLHIDIHYADPDGDPLTIAALLTDAEDDEVDDVSLASDDGEARFSWELGPRAAQRSPYTLTVAVSDGSLTTTASLIIGVISVNNPPTVPELFSPSNNATVSDNPVALVIRNSEDLDGDTLQYVFEVREGDPTGSVVMQTTVPTTSRDYTMTATPDLQENGTYVWRARAYDGAEESAYSPWTGWWSFRVNEFEEPPFAPLLVKPSDGEELVTLRPTLAAEIYGDPDGDDVVVAFEVATDARFTHIVATSPLLPWDPSMDRTRWTVDVNLDRARMYYARAWAQDTGGLISDPSNHAAFTIAEASAPATPIPTGDLGANCSGYIFADGAPDYIDVEPVTNPGDDPTRIELEIYPQGADPSEDEATYSAETTNDEPGATTRVPIDGEALASGGRYTIRIRAANGDQTSAWTTCDIIIGGGDFDPRALVIIAPERGTVFPRETTDVDVEILNGFDVNHMTLDIAYCLSRYSDFRECPSAPDEWRTIPQSVETGISRIPITGLAPGDKVYVRVCSMDGDGTCGPFESTNFSIGSDKSTVKASLCNCSSSHGLPGSHWVWLTLGIIWVRSVRRF